MRLSHTAAFLELFNHACVQLGVISEPEKSVQVLCLHALSVPPLVLILDVQFSSRDQVHQAERLPLAGDGSVFPHVLEHLSFG